MANRSVSNLDELTATSLMNNFCWYNFDSNKILVVTNSRNIVSINLFDTFILVIHILNGLTLIITELLLLKRHGLRMIVYVGHRIQLKLI